MKSVTVLFRKEDDEQIRQLEVPLEVKTSELIRHLIRYFKYPDIDERGRSIPYVLLVSLPRPASSTQECFELAPDQTLADAGVVDGSRLILSPRGSQAAKPPSSPRPPSAQDHIEERIIPISEWIERVLED